MDDYPLTRTRTAARHAFVVVVPLVVVIVASGCGVPTRSASPMIGAPTSPGPLPLDAFASAPDGKTDPSVERRQAQWRSGLVLRDLVAALVQLPEASPGHTVLAVEPPRTAFEHVLHAQLQAAGYALRLVRDPARAALRYAVHAESLPRPGDAGTGLYVFELAVGRIALRRRYRVGPCGVEPNSSLFVRGADARAVVTHDVLFALPPSALRCDVLFPEG